MAIRPIRIIGDPVLRTVCDPITEITPNVKALVEDLLEGVDMDGRAGLAANQIGVSLRAFSWNIDRPSAPGTRAVKAPTWMARRSSSRARSSWRAASSTSATTSTATSTSTVSIGRPARRRCATSATLASEHLAS